MIIRPLFKLRFLCLSKTEEERARNRDFYSVGCVVTLKKRILIVYLKYLSEFNFSLGNLIEFLSFKLSNQGKHATNL